MAKYHCRSCGHKLVFCKYVIRKDGTRIYAKNGKFIVFCPNCKSK